MRHRNDWARNYELITAMDYQVSDVLAELEEDGLAGDTIVFFWSDHGVGLPRAKRWLYESGTHVPLVVRIPERRRVEGQGQPGVTDDQLVSFVDLAPTVLNLAGAGIPEYMQGRAFLGSGLSPEREYIYGARDRMDERYDTIRSVRDKRYRYIHNYESYKPYYQYMNTPEQGPTMREIRRLAKEGQLPPAAALFLADHKPSEELYDVDQDPHEIRNLAGDPEHAATLQRMRAAHDQWTAETKDLGLIPEPELVEREKELGNRYEILRQPGTDDLVPRIQKVVAAGERGAEAVPELVAALDDPDAAVRYSACIWLGNIGKAGGSAKKALTAHVADDSAVVRVAAARALAIQGDTRRALTALEKELASPEEWVRLNAAIVLDEMGKQARPALVGLQAALEDTENKYVVRVANHAVNGLLGTSNEVP